MIGDATQTLATISYAGVPILKGDEAVGVVALYGDRENAFAESDVRLLQTLSNAMTVALENARLFDETQRLLKETEQRNAELAIINSVQAALAAELNIQGIYEAVGDKIREIFRNTDMGIRIYDPKTNLIHFPYLYEKGKRVALASMPLPEGGFGPYVIRTRGGRTFVSCVSPAGSFLSSSDPRIHFGLGPINTVESLTIRWPGARLQTIDNVPVDQITKITKPDLPS